MRLRKYIKEAKVETTNADVFLKSRCPIFMYAKDVGLLWAVYNKKTDLWDLYHNNKHFDSSQSSTSAANVYYTHMDLVQDYAFRLNVPKYKKPGSDDKFIRGRISPDGSSIFIHDLLSRTHRLGDKIYDYLVNKAVDLVYKYMGKYLK